MARYMLQLYRNRAQCAQMGAAARAHVYANFRKEKHLALLQQVIIKAIEY
jgi:hypothetical protein